MFRPHPGPLPRGEGEGAADAAHELKHPSATRPCMPASASRYCVLLTDRAWPDTTIERGILEPAGIELVEAPDPGEATLAALAADADAIITNWAGVTEAVVRAARRCQVICRTGIGLDNIAVATATELKIPVTN